MSLTAAVVILAVLTVRIFMRRCPKIYSYLLWTIVGIRLCIPFSFESRLSIFNLFAKTETEIKTAVSAPAADTVVQTAYDPYEIIGIVWLMGMLVLTVYGIFTYYRLQHKLKVSFPMGDSVYGVEGLASPFVMGFASPKIYIPLGLDRDTESYVLMHERTHLKRGDHLIKLFAFGLLCIHWFNPFCWLAFIFMSRDMEMSCDEKVLGTGDISSDYSTALLSFAQNKRFPSPGPLCFGEVSVKRRIKNILSWKKPAALITIASVVLCAIVFVACSGGPVKKTETVLPEITPEIKQEETAETTPADTTTADTTTADTTTADTSADTTAETEPAETVPPETAKETKDTKQIKDTAPVYTNTPKETQPPETRPPETQPPVTQPPETETSPPETEYNNYFDAGGELVGGIMEIRENLDGDDTEWWEYPNIQEIMN